MRTEGRDRLPATSEARPARALAGILLALGIAVAVISGVVVVYQLTQPGGAVEVLVDRDALALGDVDGLPPGTSLELSGKGGATIATGAPSTQLTLQVNRLPAGLRLLTTLPWLVLGLTTLAGAIVLRSVLLAIAAGRPFDRRNPGRLRTLGVLVLVGGLLPGLLASAATVAVLDHVGGADGDSPLGFTILDVPLNPILGAAVLFVVAAVFAHGGRLTDDLEGLV